MTTRPYIKIRVAESTPLPDAAASEDRLQVTRSQNRDKQRRYRRRQHLQGNVNVTVIVPRKQAAAFQVMARLMLDYPHLEPAVLRDTVTGKFVAIK